MRKKAKSTYEEFIADDNQKDLLDKEYKELLLSELLIAAMEHDHISVRKLSNTLSKVLNAVGYQIIFAPKIGSTI